MLGASAPERAKISVGIDATNMRMGGGLTHLVETLSHAEPERFGIERVTVYAPSATLERLPARKWLVPAAHPWLDGPLPARVAWQNLKLTGAMRGSGADVLFVPGGSYSGSFRPFVAFAQSMLPFDSAARRQYPPSWMRARNAIIRRTQERTMRRADGVIFLTEYDRVEIEREIGGVRGSVRVIPYGATPGVVPRPAAAPVPSVFRWLYMSTVDMYKHHDVLVHAAADLVQSGHQLTLDFVGPEYPPAARRVARAIRDRDPAGAVVRNLGPVPAARVKTIFSEYDGSVFASSCESFGIPLLDALQAALPTACSGLSTMPEIARDAVVYFDPLKPASAADAMRRIMTDPSLRETLSRRGPEIAKQYDWTLSAGQTMQFLAEVMAGAPRRSSAG